MENIKGKWLRELSKEETKEFIFLNPTLKSWITEENWDNYKANGQKIFKIGSKDCSQITWNAMKKALVLGEDQILRELWEYHQQDQQPIDSEQKSGEDYV